MPNGRTIFETTNPKTQSIEAVKALLSWQGKSIEPLPAAITLDGAQLTRSSKGDVYYMTTATACSCPARCYHPGEPCKHMRALANGNHREHKAFKPFLEDDGKRIDDYREPDTVRAMVIDLHDTTDLDVAYHSIKEDRIMWPVEA